LNEKVTGRFARSLTSSSVYAMKKTFARAFSPSLLAFLLRLLPSAPPCRRSPCTRSLLADAQLVARHEIWSAAPGDPSSRFFSTVFSSVDDISAVDRAGE
jgi:hypothetical protein